jgi:cation diffusion facilitator CzcD-associated flavoprotein CzcO
VASDAPRSLVEPGREGTPRFAAAAAFTLWAVDYGLDRTLHINARVSADELATFTDACEAVELTVSDGLREAMARFAAAVNGVLDDEDRGGDAASSEPEGRFQAGAISAD